LTSLITGASGFTGKALAARLLRDGEKVVAFARNPKSCYDLAELGSRIAVGDVKDKSSIEQAVKGVDTVYHIAALYREAGHPDSEYWKVNVEGTKNLLDASVSAGVRKFVHCSTIGVCGHIEHPPADENTPYAPHDIYQTTKMEGEKLALSYAREGHLPVAVARPAGIYGPGDFRFYKIFRMIKKHRFVVLGNGRPYLHLVYIDDLVDGFILCAKSEKAIGEVFTLAGNEYVEHNVLYKMIADGIGVRPPSIYLPVKPFWMLAAVIEKACLPFGIEPPIHRRRIDFFTMSRAFSIEKAKRILGYAPKVDLRTGIKKSIDWYTEKGFL
jgi:dihydroflavonol-4-reductase